MNSKYVVMNWLLKNDTNFKQKCSGRSARVMHLYIQAVIRKSDILLDIKHFIMVPLFYLFFVLFKTYHTIKKKKLFLHNLRLPFYYKYIWNKYLLINNFRKFFSFAIIILVLPKLFTLVLFILEHREPIPRALCPIL